MDQSQQPCPTAPWGRHRTVSLAGSCFGVALTVLAVPSRSAVNTKPTRWDRTSLNSQSAPTDNQAADLPSQNDAPQNQFARDAVQLSSDVAALAAGDAGAKSKVDAETAALAAQQAAMQNEPSLAAQTQAVTAPAAAVANAATLQGSSYRPAFVTERDSRFAHWSDCQLASGLMAVEKMTLGAVPGSRTELDAIRALTGVPRPQGTSLDDLARAVKARYGFNISRPHAGAAVNWTSFEAVLSRGTGAVVDGLYSQLGSPYTHWDPGFAAKGSQSYHAMYIDRYDPSTNMFWVMDPLGNAAAGYTGQWIPAANVRAYAMGMSYGSGYLEVSLAPAGQYAALARRN